MNCCDRSRPYPPFTLRVTDQAYEDLAQALCRLGCDPGLIQSDYAGGQVCIRVGQYFIVPGCPLPIDQPNPNWCGIKTHHHTCDCGGSAGDR